MIALKRFTRSQLKTGQVRQEAEAVAILNNLVIGLALHQGWRYLPHARRHYNANLQDALNLVLRHPT